MPLLPTLQENNPSRIFGYFRDILSRRVINEVRGMDKCNTNTTEVQEEPSPHSERTRPKEGATHLSHMKTWCWGYPAAKMGFSLKSAHTFNLFHSFLIPSLPSLPSNYKREDAKLPSLADEDLQLPGVPCAENIGKWWFLYTAWNHRRPPWPCVQGKCPIRQVLPGRMCWVYSSNYVYEWSLLATLRMKRDGMYDRQPDFLVLLNLNSACHSFTPTKELSQGDAPFQPLPSLALWPLHNHVKPRSTIVGAHIKLIVSLMELLGTSERPTSSWQSWRFQDNSRQK